MINAFFWRSLVDYCYSAVIASTVLSFFSQAQVGPITVGQNLWCITQRIGQTTDTILDRVNTLIDCSCNSAGQTCESIVITSTNQDVLLNVPGNYCLKNDLVGNITIAANDVTLDVNNRSVTGIISITGRQINVLNGFINAPATQSNSDPACITINSLGPINITNCVFDCTFNGAPGDAINGRTALLVTAADVLQLSNCILKGGNGSAAISAINGANGGEGLHSEGSAINQLILHNCLITSGNGGTSGPSAALTGGDGGRALYVRSILPGATTQVTIESCKIYGGNGGNGASSLITNGGNATYCLDFFIADNLVIKNCEIVPGAGGASGGPFFGIGGNIGNSGTGIHLFFNNKGIIKNCTIIPKNFAQNQIAQNGGNGGRGIFIEAGTVDMVVTDCIITGGNGTSGFTTQGNGGNGIEFDLNSSILNNIIQNCIVSGGNSGNFSGTGGDCVRINSQFDGTVYTGPKSTEIKNCTFPRSGAGSIPGRAVNDFVNQTNPGPSDNSKIYGNFAYRIQDTAVAYNIANTNTEGGFAITIPPSMAAISSFANYFVP